MFQFSERLKHFVLWTVIECLNCLHNSPLVEPRTMVLLTLLMVFCKIWSYPEASTLCSGLSCLPLSCLSCVRMAGRVPHPVGENRRQGWVWPLPGLFSWLPSFEDLWSVNFELSVLADSHAPERLLSLSLLSFYKTSPTQHLD